MMSQIGRLAYKIELRIQIDNEDFMHGTNQYEFKMDGQDKGGGPRGVFQEATQALAWGGSKGTDTGQNTGDPRVMESSILKSVIIWKMGVIVNQRWIPFLYEGRFKVTSSSRHAH